MFRKGLGVVRWVWEAFSFLFCFLFYLLYGMVISDMQIKVVLYLLRVD